MHLILSTELISSVDHMVERKIPLIKLSKHPLSSYMEIVMLHLEEELQMAMLNGKPDSEASLLTLWQKDTKKHNSIPPLGVMPTLIMQKQSIILKKP